MRYGDGARRALFGMLLVGALLGGWLASTAPAQADPPPRVTLVIDYGDGIEKRFTALDFRAQMTILDALQAAQRHPRGIQFEYRGREATGFLTRIDDLTNEGRGRNWTYQVNGKAGEQSFALQTLKAGDVVTWRYSDKR